ncbi:calcium/proton exchanger [Sporothrix schenckii ATCC 58251]|uniref:Calcium/proton exchanger n=1 Tax=Sporothrix schenckii (strain ATCC 58251 / de Perez 2211183) TaxID=1391915 RepID=U7PMK8_SPOS1|nr:calcium/proton exchanger [Sporothrix schenckii ATCC 58251]
MWYHKQKARPASWASFRSSSPASLSESNLFHYQQQQQLKQKRQEEEEVHDHSAINETKNKNKNKNPTSAIAHNGCSIVQQPVHGGDNNTAGSSSGGNTTAAVSPASTFTAPLQEAWPGPVLEDVGSGKEKEKEANLPPFQPASTNTDPNLNLNGNPTNVNVNVNGNDTSTDTKAGGTNSANGNAATVLGESEETTVSAEKATTTVFSKLSTLVVSFFVTTKMVLFRSWLNVFLVFVPAGIIVGAIPGLPPAVVFSVNAIAIIPLAGLLGFATETVAHDMGDSIGALLNVTFGNAVELIIFIALVKDEIRIVQASLLGSILANLLLILGMSFLLGGLRFREQIYNSTVTQMSACLLSLSVISLVLPTAFHASFKSSTLADSESLKISRGTSVVLLLVYGIYLLFQLKSHTYMYESTPQHIIDEESTPGPAAGWLDSSSSDDGSSSSSDSDTSGHSRDTMKQRMRRVIRGGRRRKSSVASLDTAESLFAGTTRAPSFSTQAAGGNDESMPSEEASARPSLFSRSTTSDLNEEAIIEDDTVSRRHKKRHNKRSLRRYRRHRKRHDQDAATDDVILESVENTSPGPPGVAAPSVSSGRIASVLFTEPTKSPFGKTPDPAVYRPGEPRRVDFAIADPNLSGSNNVDEFGNPTGAAADLVSARRAFNLRAMSSLRPVAKSLAPTVFTQPVGPQLETAPVGPIPRIRYGIHRTNSLPDRLNHQYQFRPPGAMLPSQIPVNSYRLKPPVTLNGSSDEDRVFMSRKAAILLLLITTGLVAACAEFMVASINGLVKTSSVGEVFIGLIILPIVGNAAEHVTAVMVAMKNKMDLAIGVAVGSSIQIALFMTPLVVILGWIIGRDMSLYFTLFETVCLFVSAFIVNFLVLDGRSNYLEGALLCSTYIIISVVAFFYPKPEDASSWG